MVLVVGWADGDMDGLELGKKVGNVVGPNDPGSEGKQLAGL